MSLSFDALLLPASATGEPFLPESTARRVLAGAAPIEVARYDVIWFAGPVASVAVQRQSAPIDGFLRAGHRIFRIEIRPPRPGRPETVRTRMVGPGEFRVEVVIPGPATGVAEDAGEPDATILAALDALRDRYEIDAAVTWTHDAIRAPVMAQARDRWG